ncbi:MAG: pilus (MSHA type) biogenesis protein MshL [Betaproteobacteria bacterium CG2_30_68_42]|nr:MAG: pilus (MSHA type) biogenesis protein MshL [Betaproteobacteria bacterium CG2_30_68_42]
MKNATSLLLVLVLAACQMGPRENATRDAIDAEMRAAAEARNRDAQPPEAVARALLPPLGEAGARLAAPVPEQRFDLAVNEAPASQVFAAIVSGTRFSMLVHPSVTGKLTLNLKDITVQEALDTIRELYGYEYKVQGTRIFVQPVSMTSRVFQVNYLTGQRSGRSDTRISSGSITTGGTGSGGATPAASGGATGGTTTAVTEGSQVSTLNQSDFWTELAQSIRSIVGTEGGRNVVVSPQAGLIVVRALPRELREVENFLRASRLSLERQVMIEAKIIEVVLSEGFQSGINWAAFTASGAHRISAGLDPRQLDVASGRGIGGQTGAITPPYSTDAGAFVPNVLGNVLAPPLAGLQGAIANSPLSGVLGLAFTTGSFAALISFLETQGTVHVLSSPRIATINNQKAVLKVGTDDFFVTNVSTTTTSSGSSTTTAPTITVQPFFSGISLDVTPQVDDAGNIILHIRPAVSVVSEREKQINLGTLGTFQLPLASSRTNETDSIVRVRDGNIVAIGGLMEQAQTNDTAKVPGVGDVPGLGLLFGQGKKALQKRELVVLLKPTVVGGDREWEQDIVQTRGRLQALEPPKKPAPPAR